MESNKKYGYLIQWLIGIGDLIVLNILFFIVYYGLNSIHTLAITGSLREVVLLLNFCYFFSLYFVPLRLHLSIVFIDKIVQRAFFLVTIMFFLFANTSPTFKKIRQVANKKNIIVTKKNALCTILSIKTMDRCNRKGTK